MYTVHYAPNLESEWNKLCFDSKFVNTNDILGERVAKKLEEAEVTKGARLFPLHHF